MSFYKKIVTIAFLISVLGELSIAQTKTAYINSEAIMEKLPEANDAQKQLDAIVTEWQNELTKMQSDLQKKFEDYDKKKLLLSDKRRAEIEKELQDLDKKVVEYRTQKFGTNGEFFTKQNELLQPVQEKIFTVVKEIANDNGYDYVFDKSSSTLLLYANVKYDLTEKVISKLLQK